VEFIEHIPILGYTVAIGEAIAGNPAEAQRAAARCTNETIKATFIGLAVAATPFEGPAAPLVWAAAGAAGDLAGSGIQAAIEESYPDDVVAKVGTEALDEWQKDPGVAFAIHAGIGAAEGIIAGGVGAIVDGAYPAAAAELDSVAAAEADEVVQLAENTWVNAGVVEDARVPRLTRIQRAAGRNEARGGLTRVTRRQAIQFIAKKPSNFMKAYKAGISKAYVILSTKEGILNYLFKSVGRAYTEATVIDAPMRTFFPGRSLSSEDASKVSEEVNFHPLALHVQGCISRKGMPAVLGQMHMGFREVERSDHRTSNSSYVYVTHSPDQKASLYIENSTSHDGFHIRVSTSTKEKIDENRYLSVTHAIHSDFRDWTSLYVHASDDKNTAATWSLEIYEETYPVLKLIDSGTASGYKMNGGYLTARFNEKTDGRRDGGAYMSIHKRPNGESELSMFGFRFKRQDELWWMDVIGDYECHDYDNILIGGKNDYHYVTIAESLDHQGLYWMNRAKRAWTLTPKVGSKDTLFPHPDCPYYNDGHKECKVIIDSNGHVDGLKGPSSEVYKRLWWRDLEGMRFEHPIRKKGTIVTAVFERHEDRNKMVLRLSFLTGGVRVSPMVLKGDYHDKNLLRNDSEFVEIIRDSYGLVSGVRPNFGTFEVFVRHSLVELLGRYVHAAHDSKRSRVVSTYVTIHGSIQRKEEVWWQSMTGETWSLKYYNNGNSLSVGPTCPYLQSGYNQCIINRDSSGQVQSLIGPDGKVYERI